MKKLCIVGVLLLFLLIGITLAIYFYNNNRRTNNINEPEINKITNDIKYLITDEFGNIKDKENDYIIYNPNKNYPKPVLDKIDKEKLIENKWTMDEYLKFFFWAFPKQSYSNFSEKDIAIIVSLTLNTYEPNSSNYVQKIAKRYFGINNYELPAGTYEVLNYGKYTIIKENNYYIRSSVEESTNSDMENTSREITNIETNGDKLTVYYDYMKGNSMNGTCYSENANLEEREKCKIGSYKIELIYNTNEDTLIVEKIEYNTFK